jgi:iron complex outermembrane recepter protein
LPYIQTLAPRSLRWFLSGVLFAAYPALAQAPRDLPLESLAQLEIEDLGRVDVTVTSVAGVPHVLATTPSAITVLTEEDIRRTGNRTIAGSLRLAPGMFVARSDSHTFRVGARGLTGALANKNLVIIDGRSVWDPLFGGVFWDEQDIVFADLDRIEVIRGPGATLWGANAMNSVVNFISKPARDTQGWYLTGGGGTYERAFGTARYGGQLGEDAWFRVYGKYLSRDAFVDFEGRPAGDEWSMLRGGFRVDSVLRQALDFTLQGDIYNAPTKGEVVNVPVAPGVFEPRVGDQDARGGNLLARVGREHEPGDGWTLQAYYDRSERRQIAGQIQRDTLDLDYRRFFSWGAGHDFVGGFGYDYTSDESQPGAIISLDPADSIRRTASAFAQNTFTLQDQWFAMLGSKLEYNSVTGLEVQPSVRLWHLPNDRHVIWAGISRAVRVPSRIEQHGFVLLGFNTPPAPGEPPVPTGVSGGGELEAERMIAYEIGHRYVPAAGFSVQTSLFYNDYTEILFPDPMLGRQFTNMGWARTYGGEIEISRQLGDRWQVAAGYAYTHTSGSDVILRAEAASHPEHIAHVRSYWDLNDDLELNVSAYYVDRLPVLEIDSYLRLDVGVTWRASKHLELSAWGQNLLRPSHRELSFREFERGVHVRGTLRF